MFGIFGGGKVPAGSQMPFQGQTLPRGWLWCDGGNYTKAAYPRLYKALYPTGTASEFNVPDMRGVFPRGHIRDLISDPNVSSCNTTSDTFNLGADPAIRNPVRVYLNQACGGVAAGVYWATRYPGSNNIRLFSTLSAARTGGSPMNVTSTSVTAGTKISQWVDPDAATREGPQNDDASAYLTGAYPNSLQTDAFGSHTHTAYGKGPQAGNYSGHFATMDQNQGTTAVTAAAGGNETRPINLSCNWIIKT